MHTRRATPDDADAVTAIYNDAIVNTVAIMWHTPKPATMWRERLTGRPARFPALVAVDEDGRVIGFTTLGPYDDLCGYDDVAEWSLYVDAAHRGRGVGRLLAEALFAEARSAGLLHTVLSRVTAGNDASIALHQRLGFREVGVYRQLGNKFGRRHDVVSYQLVLGG